MQVFIAYGGTQAETIASRLQSHLHLNGFETFLGAPASGTMIAGLDLDFQIYSALVNGDVMVAVCARGTRTSRPMSDEVRVFKNLSRPMIPFAPAGTSIPFRLDKKWAIWYNRSRPGNAFPKVVEELGKLRMTVRGLKRMRVGVYH
ncbi:MAG: hypothetical protein KGI38_08960 [Thaumarchaeota archaeon]|nr:hypothetical protein [Nitrososphaerota archaeon]